MQLSREMQESLLKQVRQKPLKPDEERRIVGMGEMYIVLSSHTPDDSFAEMQKIKLDGVAYTLYSYTHLAS